MRFVVVAEYVGVVVAEYMRVIRVIDVDIY
jgi:hypothetical protein